MSEEIQQYIANSGRKSQPGTYATGKGTTQRAVDALVGRSFGRTSEEIADLINVPSRQLSKRLNEQVKKGVLRVEVQNGRNAYFHATRAHQDALV